MLPRESGFFKWNRRIPPYCLATSVPFLFAGWLMKGMETWGRKGKKRAEDSLVHEKSKLFSYIPLSLCSSSFLAPLSIFFSDESICWMFNESLKCWFGRGFWGQFFFFFPSFLERFNEEEGSQGWGLEKWKRVRLSEERRFFFLMSVIRYNTIQFVYFLKYFFVHFLIFLFPKFFHNILC